MSPFEEVISGGTLEEGDAAEAFDAIFAGKVGEDELAAFLVAMSKRRPSVAEITGAAKSMRTNMLSIEAPPLAIDLCGTGGDGHSTLSISTAATFVVASFGVPVAKHGNRSATSRAGAADVLEALGVKIDLTPHQAQRCLERAGSCFLYARNFHPAMRHVAEVRSRLGVRTIFNLLGPLSNPARVKRQLIGVYARDWLEPMAQVLRALGTERALVVHGSDGLDELTITGDTYAAYLRNGMIESTTIVLRDITQRRATLADLKGGDAEHNAQAIRRLFEGEESPFHDIVALNAGAALRVAGLVHSLGDGMMMASMAIADGGARNALDKLIEASNA